ncbi:hypothetical protein LJB42_000855 [Komagataella kurtzmanii]|nr:hypothetical protein LJB42_000855 [Komagataella kurtzmanii]
MDFVYEYSDATPSGTFDDPLPAEPEPPFNLSNLNLYKDDLTKKFSKMSILKSLKNDTNSVDDVDDSQSISNDGQRAYKYANQSLDLVNQHTTNKSIRTTSDEQPSVSTVLSNRLSRVLNNTNYDPSTKELLSIVEKKIKGDTAHEYDKVTDPSFVGNLARRKLRNDIEHDVVDANFNFLKQLQPLRKTLGQIESDLNEMNELNNQITEKLSSRVEDTTRLDNSIHELHATFKIISIKKKLLQNFQNRYTLSHFEAHQLEFGEIDDSFLEILKKAESIHDDCSILLTMENATVGINIMNDMKKLSNNAIDRLSTFVTKHFSRLSSSNNTSASVEDKAFLKRSILFISERYPEQLSGITNQIVESRSKSLLDEFQIQLNGYADSASRNERDVNKPLFLSAYDSERFLGDLLAYIHGTIVNERETVESLFSLQDEEKDNTVLTTLVESIVSKNIESLATPLNLKIEQIIRNESKLTAIQAFYDLLSLYSMMLEKTLGSKNALLSTINSLKVSALGKIQSSINIKLKNIERTANESMSYYNEDEQLDGTNNNTVSETHYIEEITPELAVPDWLINFYGDVLPIFDNEKVTNAKELYEDLLKYCFEQIIQLIEKQIAQNKLNDAREILIFKSNCYDFVYSKIVTLNIFKEKLDRLEVMIKECESKLTEIQYTYLLKQSGLYDIHNLVNMISSTREDFFDVSVYEPITENSLFNGDKFKEISDRLQDFLPIALIDYQEERLLYLLPPTLVNSIIQNSSVDFVNFYFKLSLIVKEYLKASEGCLRWDDMEVATLLSCESAYIKQKPDIEES